MIKRMEKLANVLFLNLADFNIEYRENENLREVVLDKKKYGTLLTHNMVIVPWFKWAIAGHQK